MYLKDVKITNSFFFPEKGRVFSTTIESYPEAYKISNGDTFRHEDKIFEILSVYSFSDKKDDKVLETISFLVKEITTKELFLKLVSKEPCDTMDSVRWRIRNRWWLRPWQRIQIKFLVLKDKIWK